MSNQHHTFSIGLVTPLTLLFVALKLTGHITWSWWWVLSPMWIMSGLVLVILAVLLVVALVATWMEK